MPVNVALTAELPVVGGFCLRAFDPVVFEVQDEAAAVAGVKP